MDLPPVSSQPRSSKSELLFDESAELLQIPGLPEDFGSSTITSASPAPETAPEEQQATCCLTRCLSYIGEQISDFFDWVCSFLVSSKPVTEESLSVFIEETKAELNKKFDSSMQLIGNRYTNLQTDTSDELHKDKRLDNIYLYFADAIELTSLMVEVNEIISAWDRHLTRLKEPLDSGQIITERMLRSDKKKLIKLFEKLDVLAHAPFPLSSLESSKAIVKAFCLGRTTIATQEGICSLIDKVGGNLYSGDLVELRVDFSKLIAEQRASHTAQFKQRIEGIRHSIQDRYAHITADKIQGDSGAIALLADAIKIYTCYDGLLKGDISNTSTIEKRLGELEKHLDPANPIFKVETPAMRKAVTLFDFETQFTLDNVKDNIVAYICWSTGKEDEIAKAIEDRLTDVIDKLQNPPENSEEL